jgi:hypothetical protein
VGMSAVGAVNSARSLATAAVARTSAAPAQPGHAAARVLSRTPQPNRPVQGE